MGEGTKICAACGEEKPLDNFVKWRVKVGGYHYGPVCLHCVNVRSCKKYRQKVKEGKLSAFSDEEIISEVKKRKLLGYTD